jgi:hypothetical protein
MTATPQTLLDPGTLPVDPASCQPVYPHTYLRVNTVFEVARAHGLGTAWSDKHPAYEVLNGPSGAGVQDLFTPEINSAAAGAGGRRDGTGPHPWCGVRAFPVARGQSVRPPATCCGRSTLRSPG